MPQTKADKVADLVRRLIDAEVAELLLYRSTPGGSVPTINIVSHDDRRRLANGVGNRLSNPYVWCELADIMAWKKPRRPK
jgi:ribosomal protein S12 methylthiotransferase accessory factor YcaO